MEVQKLCRADGRLMGRLGGAQKNQDLIHYSHFWRLRGPLFLCRPYAARAGVGQKRGVQTKVSKMLTVDENIGSPGAPNWPGLGVLCLGGIWAPTPTLGPKRDTCRPGPPMCVTFVKSALPGRPKCVTFVESALLGPSKCGVIINSAVPGPSKCETDVKTASR